MEALLKEKLTPPKKRLNYEDSRDYMKSALMDKSPDKPFLQEHNVEHTGVRSSQVLNVRENGIIGSDPNAYRRPEINLYGLNQGGFVPRNIDYNLIRENVENRAKTESKRFTDSTTQSWETPFTNKEADDIQQKVRQVRRQNLKVFSSSKENTTSKAFVPTGDQYDPDLVDNSSAFSSLSSRPEAVNNQKKSNIIFSDLKHNFDVGDAKFGVSYYGNAKSSKVLKEAPTSLGLTENTTKFGTESKASATNRNLTFILQSIHDKTSLTQNFTKSGTNNGHFGLKASEDITKNRVYQQSHTTNNSHLTDKGNVNITSYKETDMYKNRGHQISHTTNNQHLTDNEAKVRGMVKKIDPSKKAKMKFNEIELKDQTIGVKNYTAAKMKTSSKMKHVENETNTWKNSSKNEQKTSKNPEWRSATQGKNVATDIASIPSHVSANGAKIMGSKNIRSTYFDNSTDQVNEGIFE